MAESTTGLLENAGDICLSMAQVGAAKIAQIGVLLTLGLMGLI